MSLTWSQFKTEVGVYLHLYASVSNLTDYIGKMIVAGTKDLQRSIRYYKSGHIETYAGGDLTAEGFAYYGTLPDGKITSARMVQYDTEEDVLNPNVFFTLKQVPWSKVPAMKGGELEYGGGAIAVNPVSRRFYVTPPLNAETRLIIEWEGVKADFADDDATPFDETAAEAVGDYVLSRVVQIVDKDLQRASAHNTRYLDLKRKIHAEHAWNATVDDEIASQQDGDTTYTASVLPSTPASPLFVFAPNITALTGGTASALDYVAAVDLAVNTTYFLIIGGVQQYWRLVAGTNATSIPDGFVRGLDYDGTKVWQRLT